MLRRVFVGTLLLAMAVTGRPVSAQQELRGGTSSPPTKSKLNVLFIAVDDLRPIGGAYGSPVVKTPNMDALARRGVTFNRAYCQQAVCSPSRTSLLTGRRPDTTKVYNLSTHFRSNLPDVVTLPQRFKQEGYYTQALSKIYHGGLDDPPSWSVPSWFPPGATYTAQLRQVGKEHANNAGPVAATEPGPNNVSSEVEKRRQTRGPSWYAPDVPDGALNDGMTADKAIATLREIKDRPFFLAVGFLKPHLPFIAPQKYYDLYPPERIKLPANRFPPKNVPPPAMTDWGELRFYSDIPLQGPVSDAKALELIRGYYAGVSYADAQIGRVLDEVDRLGLRDKTIVVLWGDHGWQLGEHGVWCKHTNFEVAVRSPLIINSPQQQMAGAKTDGLVEFVDIYPTLCELAGLPAPEGLEGTSLVPLMKNPRRLWKKAAFSQYPRRNLMGYSIKTDRYRYTEWVEPGKGPQARELYDHLKDPHENINTADDPAHARLVEQLSNMLRDGWRAALPSGK